jgi:transcriptional regulator with XRE-family HTH domain
MKNIAVGNNIRNWRIVKSIKQSSLAASLKISPAALSELENGKTNITVTRLYEIAEAMDLRPEQLFQDPFKICDEKS